MLPPTRDSSFDRPSLSLSSHNSSEKKVGLGFCEVDGRGRDSPGGYIGLVITRRPSKFK